MAAEEEAASTPGRRSARFAAALKRAAVFVLLTIAIDFAVGAVCERLFLKTLTGERGGLTNYALTKEADVLVLGSSRAQFHVMPSILGRELSLRTFNAGLKGHDLLYAVMLADLWKRRHPAPRAIVLTVDLDSLARQDTEIAAAQVVAPYIGESDLVREVLYQGGPYKQLEYLSRAYRFNGKVLPILKNLFVRPQPDSDGFWPQYGVIPLEDPTYGLARHGLLEFPPPGEQASDEMAMATARRPFWDAKVRYLEALARDGHRSGTQLFLVHSPIYGLSRQAHEVWTARIRELARTLPGTWFLDICEFTEPEVFAGKPELFKDFAHLNARGAIVFSEILARHMKARLGALPPVAR